MSKTYVIIIHSVPPLTTFYRSGVQRSDVYKWDAFVTAWGFYNRRWQPQRRDCLPETSGTLWIHRGTLTNQRCSLATGCGIKRETTLYSLFTTLTNNEIGVAAQYNCTVLRSWHILVYRQLESMHKEEIAHNKSSDDDEALEADICPGWWKVAPDTFCVSIYGSALWCNIISLF